MRVVHVCASDIIGGAARAAFRIHSSLQDIAAVDSMMLVRGRASDDINVKVYAPKRLSLVNFFNSALKRRVSDLYWSSFVTSNKVMHSRADIRTGLLSNLNYMPCDLVHLHWLGPNTMSIEEIGQINRPVVWTLHDMWAFNGAEHYVPDGLGARFRSGYTPVNRTAGEDGPDMNRSVWSRKEEAWKNPMTIVCPSRWLADCAGDSALFRKWPVHCIPNPLDLQRWKPFPKEHARDLLGLPQDKRIVLFGAIGGEADPRKGADLLRQALTQLKKQGKEDLQLVIFGQSQPEKAPLAEYPMTYLGRINDDFTMIAIYSAADVMVVPSRQEAFGQTASEAHACGVPVVAFKVGGLPDIVDHRTTGYLAEPYDVESLAAGIAWVLGNGERRFALANSSRDAAVRKFSAPVVAKSYADLYERVLVCHREN